MADKLADLATKFGRFIGEARRHSKQSGTYSGTQNANKPAPIAISRLDPDPSSQYMPDSSMMVISPGSSTPGSLASGFNTTPHINPLDGPKEVKSSLKKVNRKRKKRKLDGTNEWIITKNG